MFGPFLKFGHVDTGDGVWHGSVLVVTAKSISTPLVCPRVGTRNAAIRGLIDDVMGADLQQKFGHESPVRDH